MCPFFGSPHTPQCITRRERFSGAGPPLSPADPSGSTIGAKAACCRRVSGAALIACGESEAAAACVRVAVARCRKGAAAKALAPETAIAVDAPSTTIAVFMLGMLSKAKS